MSATLATLGGRVTTLEEVVDSIVNATAPSVNTAALRAEVREQRAILNALTELLGQTSRTVGARPSLVAPETEARRTPHPASTSLFAPFRFAVPPNPKPITRPTTS